MLPRTSNFFKKNPIFSDYRDILVKLIYNLAKDNTRSSSLKSSNNDKD